MAVRFGVVFLVSMVDILANPVEICFGSFTTTSTALEAAISPTASVKATTTSDAAPSSGKKSKTHPPKPYDIVQGMERVINMMEETLQICERAQRSTQDASHHKTIPFGLRPPSDVHTRQEAKSMQIQSGDSNHPATSRSKLAPVTIR
jgi:D-mannonate dehydratase